MIFLNLFWTKYLELLEFNSVKFILSIKKVITSSTLAIKFQKNILKFHHLTEFTK